MTGEARVACGGRGTARILLKAPQEAPPAASARVCPMTPDSTLVYILSEPTDRSDDRTIQETQQWKSLRRPLPSPSRFAPRSRPPALRARQRAPQRLA